MYYFIFFDNTLDINIIRYPEVSKMDKWNIAAWIIFLCCLGVLFTYSCNETKNLDELQRGIADEIVRFHVRANSDSDEDQALKLKVKEAVVEYLSQLLIGNNEKADTIKIINENIESVENLAKSVIMSEGKEYNVTAYFENSYFPIKKYADMTFPAGYYDAFRIDIGSAKGKNWWCVLYPRLCFVDITYGVVPEDSKDELKTILDDDEYEIISGKKTKVVYEFKIFKFLNKIIK